MNTKTESHQSDPGIQIDVARQARLQQELDRYLAVLTRSGQTEKIIFAHEDLRMAEMAWGEAIYKRVEKLIQEE